MIGEIKLEYYDTIIVGAGLAGCTLGNLLLKENKKVVIIENQDLNKKINYVVALSHQKHIDFYLKYMVIK